jgi:predicted GIY-YIG superfamily endonuclease
MTEPEAFTIYLLHFEPPVRGKSHYLGVTRFGRLPDRLKEHAAGRGSNLTSAAREVGARIFLGHVWPRVALADEARLKRAGHFKRHCWLCARSPQLDQQPAMLEISRPNQRPMDWRAIDWETQV